MVLPKRELSAEDDRELSQMPKFQIFVLRTKDYGLQSTVYGRQKNGRRWTVDFCAEHEDGRGAF